MSTRTPDDFNYADLSAPYMRDGIRVHVVEKCSVQIQPDGPRVCVIAEKKAP